MKVIGGLLSANSPYHPMPPESARQIWPIQGQVFRPEIEFLAGTSNNYQTQTFERFLSGFETSGTGFERFLSNFE
jgi:hypothetical protein